MGSGFGREPGCAGPGVEKNIRIEGADFGLDALPICQAWVASRQAPAREVLPYGHIGRPP